MYPLFVDIEDIDTTEFCKFLRDEFFIVEQLHVKLTEVPDNQFMIFQRPMILKYKQFVDVENLFMTRYDLPRFSNFIVFKHFRDQPIHTDGLIPIRHTTLSISFNENDHQSEVAFYLEKSKDVKPVISAGLKYNPDDVFEICVMPKSNNWFLLNSAVPHGARKISRTEPRYTLSFRFENNPTFDSIYFKSFNKR